MALPGIDDQLGLHPFPETFVYLTGLSDDDIETPQFSTRTQEDGPFSFQDLPEDRYHLTVCKEGFITLESTVIFSRKATARPSRNRVRIRTRRFTRDV